MENEEEKREYLRYDEYSLQSPKARKKYTLESLRERARRYRKKKRDAGLCAKSGCQNLSLTYLCEGCKEVHRKYKRKRGKTCEKEKIRHRKRVSERYYRMKAARENNGSD